jgi:putative membrane protein
MRRLMRCWPLVLVLTAPAARAHGDPSAGSWWSLDPWVWLPILFACAFWLRGILLLRVKRRVPRAAGLRPVCAFGAAICALFVALIWPLDALSAVSFAAHMAQHMLLMAVAAPLLVLAEPALPLMLGLPRRWRAAVGRAVNRLRKGLRPLLRPRVAFSIHGLVIWVWHAPLPFELALRMEWVHVLEHCAFFGSGLLFWAALLRSGREQADGYGAAALWCLATLIHTGMLGALITFAPRPIYASYNDTDNHLLSPLEDQQLAGLLMWIPAGLCYLAVGLGFVAAWLRGAERRPAHPGS